MCIRDSYEINVTNYSVVSSHAFVNPTVTFAQAPNSAVFVGTVKNNNPFQITDAKVVLWFPNITCLVETYDFAGTVASGQAITFALFGCGQSQPSFSPIERVAAQAIVVP